MKKGKRALALVLSIVLVVGLMTAGVSAAGPVKYPLENDEYYMEREDVAATVEALDEMLGGLLGDLDLSAVGTTLTPILEILGLTMDTKLSEVDLNGILSDGTVNALIPILDGAQQGIIQVFVDMGLNIDMATGMAADMIGGTKEIAAYLTENYPEKYAEAAKALAAGTPEKAVWGIKSSADFVNVVAAVLGATLSGGLNETLEKDVLPAVLPTLANIFKYFGIELEATDAFVAKFVADPEYLIKGLLSADVVKFVESALGSVNGILNGLGDISINGLLDSLGTGLLTAVFDLLPNVAKVLTGKDLADLLKIVGQAEKLIGDIMTTPPAVEPVALADEKEVVIVIEPEFAGIFEVLKMVIPTLVIPENQTAQEIVAGLIAGLGVDFEMIFGMTSALEKGGIDALLASVVDGLLAGLPITLNLLPLPLADLAASEDKADSFVVTIRFAYDLLMANEKTVKMAVSLLPGLIGGDTGAMLEGLGLEALLDELIFVGSSSGDDLILAIGELLGTARPKPKPTPKPTPKEVNVVPATGDAGIALVASVSLLAAAGFVFTRKKED